MKKNGFTFLLGFAFGALVCFIIWYWEKSTTADEAALDLLDDLAAARAQIRELESMTTVTDPTSPEPDQPVEDLTQIRGIGPVFAARLHEEGIDTVAQLTAVPPADLAEILEIGENRAESILKEGENLQ